MPAVTIQEYNRMLAIANTAIEMLEALDEYRANGRIQTDLYPVHDRERRLRKLIQAELTRQHSEYCKIQAG